MKKLGDYKGEEAIELWADLLEPIGEILQNKEVAKVYRAKGNPVQIAKVILKENSKAATQILLRVDPTPINGLNILVRLVEILMEFERSEELKGFFGFAETVTDSGSSGNVTANTEGAEI